MTENTQQIPISVTHIGVPKSFTGIDGFEQGIFYTRSKELGFRLGKDGYKLSIDDMQSLEKTGEAVKVAEFVIHDDQNVYVDRHGSYYVGTSKDDPQKKFIKKVLPLEG